MRENQDFQSEKASEMIYKKIIISIFMLSYLKILILNFILNYSIWKIYKII